MSTIWNDNPEQCGRWARWSTDWTPLSPTRCGLRIGYMELVNLDPAVMKHILTMFSTDTCAPVLGQIALDLMMNPPQPGEPSYPLYHMVRTRIYTAWFSYRSIEEFFFFFFCIPAFSSCLLQETQNIKNTLAGNVKRAVEVVNSLPGLCCQPLEGGAFVFPRVYLPPSFIQKAKVNVDINQRCDQKKRAYQWFKYYQPGHVFVYFRKRDWNQIHSTVVDYWKRLVCSSVLVLSTDKRRAPTTSGITHHATLVCSPYCRPANDTEVPAAVPPDYRTAIFSPGSTH